MPGRARPAAAGGDTHAAPSKYHDEIISLVFFHAKYGEPIVIMDFRCAIQKVLCLTPPPLQVINYLVLVPTLACIDAAWLKTKLICQVQALFNITVRPSSRPLPAAPPRSWSIFSHLRPSPPPPITACTFTRSAAERTWVAAAGRCWWTPSCST